MPACHDNCRAGLAADGMPPRKAARCAYYAFWQEHGKTPAAADREGMDCSCDLLPRARVVSQTLSAQAELQVLQLEHAQTLSDDDGLEVFADVALDPPTDGIPRVLREVKVICPGSYNGHEWTEADLREIEAAYDPADPPPIQMQHERSPGERHGRVRGLRLRDDGWLWALCEFVGQRAFEAVTARLWDQTSAGLVVAPYQELFELSVVDRGAVPGSAIQNQTEVLTMPVPPGAPQGATPAAAAAPTNPAQEAQTPAPAPAGAAALADGLKQVATALSAAAAPTEAGIMADMQAKIAALEAKTAEQDRLLQLQADTQTVVELMAAGKSIPALQDKELKFLGSLSADQRAEYVALRHELPNAWPQGRQTVADLAKPGVAARDEADYQRLSGKAAAESAPASTQLAGATK